VLAIAPSTYHAHVARRAKPETAPARVRRDTLLSVEIKRVFNENFQVYGVRKVWRQLLREGHDVARCTVARLMRKMALQGVIRGRRVRTTVSDKATPCPLDHVNRRFRAPRPNVLWVSDFHLRGDVERLRLRRQLRQCARRDDQRALQGRSDPSALTVAVARGGRVRHARMGRLVQQPKASRADRPCATG
jgi:hypothetical protein